MNKFSRTPPKPETASDFVGGAAGDSSPALQAVPTATAGRSRPVGRPKKAAGAKAKGITVTLWPDELAALEELRAKVNEGLPAEVGRSDLARLAFSLLLEKSPREVRSELSKVRK